MNTEDRPAPTREPDDDEKFPPLPSAEQNYEIVNIYGETDDSYNVEWKALNNRKPKTEWDWIGIYKIEPDYAKSGKYIGYGYIPTDQSTGTMSVKLESKLHSDDLYFAYMMWKWYPVAIVQVKDFK